VRSNTSNPFQHISFNERDLRGIEPGGGGPKVFVDVDSAYRETLVNTLDLAAQEVAPELGAFPHALGPMIFRLRQEGIAKSHRPIKLVEEAGLIPAGHERIEEMLVGAHAASIAALRSIILERDIQAIRANLSVIQSVEPWSRPKRNPEGTVALRERGSALLRFFRYANDAANAQLFEQAKGLLSHLGLKHRFFRQGRHGWFYVCLFGLDDVDEEKFDVLLSFPGVRRLMPEPSFHALATAGPAPVTQGAAQLLPLPPGGLPMVAVFDTGVAPSATDLQPWVVGSEIFVLPPETDHEHGTNVASLVAGAYVLNDGHEDLPQVGSLVYNVCGLESVAGGGRISDLTTRLEEALKRRPDVRVWNLSLGAPSGCAEQTFSEFAQTLDRLSDQYNVLFVVAAGNYVSEPRRAWPVVGEFADRVSSPGDSVRALTVGSVCHISATDALNASGEPAAYSRRGPGPVFTPKPDIVHAGGGVHGPWSSGSSSVAVLSANSTRLRSFGTSFAAPIAASMAAHAWQAIDRQQGLNATPSLVKAVMIHAAQLSSPAYTPSDRRYYGTGMPRDVIAGLYDRADSFTLAFDVRLVPGMRWRKSPYPIPSGLLREGKLAAEVIITAVYSPPLDPDAGAEYVRANVELSFGTLDGDNISSKVPMKGEDGADGYEAMQIEHGGKWAPVKVHRKRFAQGITGTEWALQARMFMRAFEPPMAEGLQVQILCTLRALDGNANIYAEGMRALAATNWASQALPATVPIHVRT
jgi:serine protease AprX